MIINSNYTTPVGIFDHIKLENELAYRLVITGKCNLNCEFCVYKEKNYYSPEVESLDFCEMSPSQKLKDYMSFMGDRMGYSTIHLTGGEPTLNNNIIEIAKLAKICNQRIHIVTNLVLVEPILNLLQEDLLDELTFTIMPKDEKNIRRVESDSNYLTNDAKRYETVKKHALLIRSLYSKLEIKANIVVSGLTDISDCISLINWCWNNNIKPRVQRDRSYRRIDGSTRAVNILLEKLIMTPNNVVIRIPGANESCMFKNSNNQELKVKVFNQNIRLDSVCKPCNQRFTCDKSFSSLRLFEKPYSPILALCAKVDKYYAMMDLENLYRSDVVNEINYFKNNPTEYFAKFNTIFNFQ